MDLLENAAGRVLEIGAGTGANIECYTPAVSELVLTEPDVHMRGRLRKKVSRCKAEKTMVTEGSVELINQDDASFDCVVGTLVLCSVRDLEGGLKEIKRVLKPGGRLLFMEHVAAPRGSRRRRWQNWINPVWRRVNSNCHLNRETEQAVVAAGFSIHWVRRESMRKAMPIVRPTIRGIAHNV